MALQQFPRGLPPGILTDRHREDLGSNWSFIFLQTCRTLSRVCGVVDPDVPQGLFLLGMHDERDRAGPLGVTAGGLVRLSQRVSRFARAG